MRYSSIASKFFLTVAVAAVSPLIAAAQSATLQGVVTAAETQRPVAGARVAVGQPARVAITDENGRFTIHDLAPRSYDVSFSALGRTTMVKTVEVAAGAAAELDAELQPGSLMLSSVIISATRTPTEARRVAATVNVLSPEQVRTTPARETQDMLREIPGVELPRQSSTVGGTSQIVSIRGVDEGRTVVTFDGVPISDAWGEWIDWSKVPKALVDHVEVVEGGTSNLYGNGAMGGAISFFSRPVSPGSYELRADGGSRDSRHAFASAGLPITHTLALSASGDYADGGGYRLIAPANAGPVDQVSDAVVRNALARLEFTPSDRVSAYATGHLFSDNRNLGTDLSNTDRNSKSMDFGVNGNDVAGGVVTLRAWDSEQRENQYTTAIAADRKSERRTAILQIPSHDWGGGLQWNRSQFIGLQSMTVGADFRHMDGFTGETDFAASGTQSYVFSGGDQVLSGAFAQAVAEPVRDVRIEAGTRFDHWGNNNGVTVDSKGRTDFDDKSRNAVSPRIGLRLAADRALSVHTAFYRAFRAPNLAELYRKFTSGSNLNLPNPELKPEYATGYEVGFDWQPTHYVQLKATGYNADMKDLNTFVVIAPGQRQRQNVQKTRSRGGEVYLAVRPVQELMLSASINYDDDKIVAGPAGTVVGQRVGRVPVQKQVVRASWTNPTFGSWTLIGRHEGVNTTLQGIPLAPFTVADANVQKEFLPGITAFASLENISNEQYQIALSAVSNGIATLGLPRTLRIGVQAVRY
jgi:outer membrane receptor protein involved in Fe transport